MRKATDGLLTICGGGGLGMCAFWRGNLETVRVELRKKNIHVTVLYPGYIDTPINQMLKRRPFLISPEKGAAVIADLMEKKVKSSTVPVFPWNIIGRVMKILPAGMVAKI